MKNPLGGQELESPPLNNGFNSKPNEKNPGGQELKSPPLNKGLN